MEPGDLIILILGLASAGGVAAVAWFSLTAARGRTQQLGEAATRLQLRFSATCPADLELRLEEAPFLAFGRWKPSFRNVLTGRRGAYEVALFDYRYSPGGSDSYGNQQSVVLVAGKELDLPRFHLRHPLVWDAIAEACPWPKV